MKKLRITIEGKAYEVLVEILDQAASATAAVISTAEPAVVVAPASAPTAAAVTTTPRAPSVSGSGDIVSPLAGKIVSVDVTVGQSVEEGAQVATIEAMKMNTYIYAPKAGRVAAVLARPGDAVEEGVTLLRLA